MLTFEYSGEDGRIGRTDPVIRQVGAVWLFTLSSRSSTFWTSARRFCSGARLGHTFCMPAKRGHAASRQISSVSSGRGSMHDLAPSWCRPGDTPSAASVLIELLGLEMDSMGAMQRWVQD